MSSQQSKNAVSMATASVRRDTSQVIETAKTLVTLKGTEHAARYLRRRGFSFLAAHVILLGIAPRR